MSALHITIVHKDDDHLSIEVNGDEVASANHDEHGWSGMDAVEKTARAIAEAAGIDVSEQWGGDEEDEAITCSELPSCRDGEHSASCEVRPAAQNDTEVP